MKFSLGKLMVTVCLAIISCQAFSQGEFRKILRAAFDSTEVKNFYAALALLHQAQTLKGVDTAFNIGELNMYLGINYEGIKRNDSSIYFYVEAIKYFENKKDATYLSYLYQCCGLIEFHYTENYGQALEDFRKQLVYERLQQNDTSFTNCLNHIGLTFKSLEKYDSSLLYFNLVLSSTSADKQLKTKTLRQIGDIYSNTEHYDEASVNYDSAIHGFWALKDTLEICVTFINKGDCLWKQGRFAESLSFLKQAEQYLTTDVTDQQKSTLYHNLADVYSHIKDSGNAFLYKNMEGNLKDSINTQNIQKVAAQMQAIYQTEKIKDNLTISEKNRVIANNRFYGVLIGAIVICLVAFLALRNATLRKKANVKLAAQKAKVEALAADLEEANQTKARLFSVISHDLRSPVSSLYASLRMQELKGGNGESNGTVSSQIMHLLDTLEDLLTWSKSQMDRFTLQPVTLRIADMYADLIELHHDAAGSKQITIVNKAERQVKIYTDENLLKTILRNVLANSIHHAPNKSTVLVDAVSYENGVVCTISNEATATDAAMLESRLQTAAIGSSKHGLGNVLIKEFTEKLQADFELTYANGKVYLQIKVPAMQKPVNTLQPVG